MPVSKPITTLPDWAFKALGSNCIEALIDRIEHEIIVIARRGVPEFVLLSSAEWSALTAAAGRRQNPNQTAPTAQEKA